MDYSTLLILLFGGLAGWMLKHWLAADELAAYKRKIQIQQIQSASEDSPSQLHHEQSHHSQGSSTTHPSHVNGVALNVIEEELGELYQLSAQVKPLEFELQKTRDQLQQLKSIQGTHPASIVNSVINAGSGRAPSVAATRSHSSVHASTAYVENHSFDADNYTVHLTTDEPITDEVGELYQLVAKVKPLQHELSRVRKNNNTLAADKERVERRLKSQLDQHNQLQESHKLELARGLSSKLSQKDARIAELQSRVEKSGRWQSECNSLSEQLAKEVAMRQSYEEQTQELTDQIDTLHNTLTEQQAKAKEDQAKALATAEQRTAQLRTLQTQWEDQQSQLSQSRQQLDKLNQSHAAKAQSLLSLQKTASGSSEKLNTLRAELDQSTRRADAAQREKNDALTELSKIKSLLNAAETRTAELTVQQTQAEQQWRYEMSSLQSAASSFDETKAKAADDIARLEKAVSESNREKQALETRLTAHDEKLSELNQALESSQSSVQSYAEYSKMAEDKVLQLNNNLAQRDADLTQLKQQYQDLQSSNAQTAKHHQESIQRLEQASSGELLKLKAQLKDSEGSRQALEQKALAAQAQFSQQGEQLKTQEEQYQTLSRSLKAKMHDAERNADKIAHQNKTLEESLEKAQQSARESQAALESATKQLEASQAKLQSHKTTTDKEIFSIRESHLQELAQHKQLAESANQTERALQAKTAELEALSKQHTELQHEKQSVVVQLNTTSQSLSDLKSAQSQQQDEARAQALEKLKQETSKLQALDAQYQSSQAMIAQLTDQVKAGKAQFDNAQQSIQSLTTELKKSHQESQSLTQAHKQLEQQAQIDSSTAKQAQQLSVQLKQSQHQLQTLNSERALLQEKFDADAAQSRKQVQELTQTLAIAQQTSNDLKEKAAQAENIAREAEKASAEAIQQATKQAQNTDELKQLREQVASLKSQTSKYALFQKEAQATARELLEAKQSLKILDTKTQAASDAEAKLSSSNIEIARLQRELTKAKRYQVELREQSAVLTKLKSQIKQSADTQTALEQQQEVVNSLELELKARDKALKQSESSASKQAKRDSGRIDKASAALKASKQEISELNRMLAKAETASKKAQDNDIELRRLKSELRALQAQRSQSAKSLKASKLDTTALKELEAGIAQRDKQIAQLKKRLEGVASNSATSRPAPNKAAKPKPRKANTTLFAVPKEKDDLKRINGIGPVLEKTLNKLGITSFKQVAGFTKSDIQRVQDAIDTFPGRIERDDWVGGAAKQYELKYKSKAEV